MKIERENISRILHLGTVESIKRHVALAIKDGRGDEIGGWWTDEVEQMLCAIEAIENGEQLEIV